MKAPRKHVALLLSAVLLWKAACTSLQSDCKITGDNEQTMSDDNSLLQLSLDVAGAGGSSNSPDKTCEMLSNKVSYFSVKVCIAFHQCFAVVLDSGSNNLLVPACSAQGPNDPKPCFSREKSDSWEDSGRSQLQSFGQGAVDTDIGTDMVTMAGKTATMVNGVYLMTSYHSKKMEWVTGIMGVGVGDGGGDDKVFIKRTGVERFSICFRDMGKDGALRLDVPELVSPLPSIGSRYWSLGLNGISVGAHDAVMKPLDIILCNLDEVVPTPGRNFACAMIVDSGTTRMLGPADDISKLRSALCRSWKRCSHIAELAGGTLELEESIFQALVLNCARWMTEDKGLLEIPSLFLSMGGSGVIELTAWAWITEYGPPGHHYCRDSFGTLEWAGAMRGSVWIFGTPLFYEYQVSFDFAYKQIELKKGKCLACGEGMSLSEETVDHRRPRWMLEPGTPHIPQYNISFPP